MHKKYTNSNLISTSREASIKLKNTPQNINPMILHLQSIFIALVTLLS